MEAHVSSLHIFVYLQQGNYAQTGNYRLILGVRNDLKMQKGKVAAQCAHAAVAAYVKASIKAPDALAKWARNGTFFSYFSFKYDSMVLLFSLDLIRNP